mmetsp:Transcript_21141/g.55005  ORF Transcript_21141/g.55005 Transcript_21141/m.55005 type:complete len:285 (-) Transcript_21141:1019-1873(-)
MLGLGYQWGWRANGLAAIVGLLALGAPTPTTAAPNDDFNFGDAECKSFNCRGDGLAPVPTRPLRLVARGCSSMGGMTMMGGGNDEMTPCCNLRQACFQTCGASKAKCEQLFEKCTNALCAQNHPGDSSKEESCKKTGNLYVTMSKIGGCRVWDAAQAAACECVDEADAMPRRTKTLTEVYKKVKEKGKKIDSLIEKHGTSSQKFAKLLLRLVRKYPKLIKVKRSPEDEMMERIRRGNFNMDDIPKGPSGTSAPSGDGAAGQGSTTEVVEDEEAAEEEEVVHDEM